MEIFIESINVEKIDELNKLGIITGISTLAEENIEEKIILVADDIPNELSRNIIIKINSNKVSEAVRKAIELDKVIKGIIISVSIGEKGFRIVKELSKMNIKTNVVGINSSVQGVFAKLSGATYITISIKENEQNYKEILRSLNRVYREAYEVSPKIIATDCESISHIENVILEGANIGVLKYEKIKNFISIVDKV